MFRGLLSLKEKDEPREVSVTSFDELLREHRSEWAVRRDRNKVKKVANLKPAEFQEYFALNSSDGERAPEPTAGLARGKKGVSETVGMLNGNPAGSTRWRMPI